MLYSLRIESFRSYQQDTYVPLEDPFVAVLGPNGAGKSGLAAAIAFVAGTAPDDATVPQTMVEARLRSGICFRRTYEAFWINGQTVTANQYAASWRDEVGGMPVIVDVKMMADLSSLHPESLAEYVASLNISNFNGDNPDLVPGFEAPEDDGESRFEVSARELTRIVHQLEEAQRINREVQNTRKDAVNAVRKLEGILIARDNYARIKRQLQEALDTRKAEVLSIYDNFGEDIRDRLANAKQRLVAHRAKRDAAISRAEEILKRNAAARRSNIRARELVDTHSEHHTFISTKVSVVSNQVAEIQARRRDVDPQLSKIRDDVKAFRQDLERISRHISTIEATDNNPELHTLRIAIQHNEALSEYHKVRVGVENIITTLEGAQGRVDMIQAQVNTSEHLCGSHTTRILEYEKQLESLELEEAEIIDNQQKVRENIVEAVLERNGGLKQLQNLKQKIKHSKISSHIAQTLQHRRDIIQYLRARHPGVVDTLSQLVIPREHRFQNALLRALGSHVDSVLVDTVITAEACIEDLRANTRGRMTFIVIDEVRSGFGENMRPTQILPPEIEYVFDIVICPENVRPALLYAVSTCVIAPTMQKAIAIRKMGVKSPIVCLNGSMLLTSFLLSSPPTAHSDGGNVSSMFRELERASSTFKTLQQRIEDFEMRQDALSTDIQRVRDAIPARRISLDDERRKLRSEKASLRNLQEALSHAASNLLHIQDRHNNAEHQLSILEASVKVQLTKDFQLEPLSFDDLLAYQGSGDYGEISRQQVRLQGEFLSKKFDLAAAEKWCKKLAQWVQDSEHEEKTVKEQLTLLRQELILARAELDASTAASETCVREINTQGILSKESSQAEEQAEAQYQVSLEQFETLKSELNTHEEHRDTIEIPPNDEIEELEAQLSDNSVAQGAVLQLEMAQSRLRQSKQACVAARKHVRNLQIEGDEFLIMRSRRFMPRLRAVRHELDAVYQQLTRGGHASLTAIDVNTPWSGLVLSIQPHNKPYEAASAMSGGERALAVLALVLAAQRAQGSSIVVFDEVDAALDHTNTLSVLKCIENMLTSVQFIVLTHKPVIYSHADRLVGVYNTGTCSHIISKRLYTSEALQVGGKLETYTNMAPWLVAPAHDEFNPDPT